MLLKRLTRFPPAVLVFLLLCPFYILCGKGWVSNVDATAIMNVSLSLVERGAVDVPEGSAGAIRGADGRFYSKSGIGKSLVNVPSVAACMGLSQVLPGYPKERLCGLTVSLVNPVITALTCAVLFSLLRSLSFNGGESLRLTLLYAFATIAFPYAKDDMTESLASLLIVAAVRGARAYVTGASSPPLWATALVLGGLAATRYELSVIAGLVAVYVAAGAGPRRAANPRAFRLDAILASVVLMLIAVGVVAFNYRRFGHPFTTGFHLDPADGFAFDPGRWLIQGLGLLLSPGRGLFVYMPFLLLAPAGLASFHRLHRREATLLTVTFLTVLVIVSGYNSWFGGWAWGPRYLLPVLALLLPAVGFALRRPFFRRPPGQALAGALVLVSVLVQLSAVVVPWRRYLTEVAARQEAGESVEIMWSLRDSQPVAQWRQWRELLALAGRPDLRQSLQYDTRLTGASSATMLTTSLGLNAPEFWFVHLYYFGVPVALIAAVIGVLLAMSAAAAYALSEQLRRSRHAGATMA